MPEPETKSVTFAQCKVQNLAKMSNALDSTSVKILFTIFILLCGVSVEGVCWGSL